MISEILKDKFTTDYIIYTRKPEVKDFYLTEIKKKHNIKANHIIDLEKLTQKDLDSWLIQNTFSGDKWFLTFTVKKDPEKRTEKTIQEFFKILKRRGTSIKVIFIDDYAIFRYIQRSDTVNEYRSQIKISYEDKFQPADLRYLETELLENQKIKVTQEVKKLMRSEYLNNPDKVLKLYELIKQGVRIKNREEVINKIGFGENTIYTLIYKILTSQSKTKEGIIRLKRDAVERYQYLKQNKEDYPNERVMFNQMKVALKTLYEIKILYYKDLIKDDYTLDQEQIPEIMNKWGIISNRKNYKQIVEKIKIFDIIELLETMSQYQKEETAVIGSIVKFLEEKERLVA